MNIGNPKLIKQLESLVDNRQDWLFRFAYIRIGQREDAEDIVCKRCCLQLSRN